MLETKRIQHGLVWWIRDRNKPAARASLAIFCSSETDDVLPFAAARLTKIGANLNLGGQPE